MVMTASIDARDLSKALRTLTPELSKATAKRMRDLSKEVRDDVRKRMPVGPTPGHFTKAVTSGAFGVVPYVAVNPTRYPYWGWMEFGGRRPRDRRARPVVRGGRWLYPRVGAARTQLLRDVEDITVDVIRRVGFG